MLLQSYSVHDAAVKHFHLPWFQQTQEEAVRSFKRLVNEDGSPMNLNPEDFDLFHIGSFDGNTGIFEKLDTPVHIAKAISLKNHSLKTVENDLG